LLAGSPAADRRRTTPDRGSPYETAALKTTTRLNLVPSICTP
jgi:hypothetical protein